MGTTSWLYSKEISFILSVPGVPGRCHSVRANLHTYTGEHVWNFSEEGWGKNTGNTGYIRLVMGVYTSFPAPGLFPVAYEAGNT